MSNILTVIPSEIIVQIALYLPISNVINFCLSNHYLNAIINDSNYFWHQTYIKDYEELNYPVDNWKELHRNYLNVWSFGANYSGQLGLDGYEHRNIPTQIPNLKAKYIAAGLSYTVVIDWSVKTNREEFHSSANNVWTCGRNDCGQLCLGDYKNRKVLTQIPNIKAQQVAAGADHSLIIRGISFLG